MRHQWQVQVFDIIILLFSSSGREKVSLFNSGARKDELIGMLWFLWACVHFRVDYYYLPLTPHHGKDESSHFPLTDALQALQTSCKILFQ